MPTVRDLMEKRQKSAEVAAIAEDAHALDAVKLMAERRIGSVVVKSQDKVVGIFTERDVLNRVVAVEKDPGQIVVKDVMSSPVACCQPDTKLAECKAIMTSRRLRHLPIVEGGELVGMMSIGDLAAFEADEQAHTIQYLHEYLHGRM